MDSRIKTIGKWSARLVGVALGLALALFLFSSVAFGHGYGGGGYGMSYYNQCGQCRFFPRQRENIRINIRINVQEFRFQPFERCCCGY